MIHKFKSWWYKKQSCPTVEDIENRDLKNVADRLKGDSDKETLTNILEWQDRNIQFWNERVILESQWLFLAIFIIVLYIFVYSRILILLHFYLVSSKLLSVSVSQILVPAIFFVFLIVFIFQNALIRMIYVLLLFSSVYQLEKIYLISSVKNPAIDVILSLTSLNGVLFGTAILSLTYLAMSYRYFFRTDPLIVRIKKILHMMNDTFQLSLSAEKVLDYRMAICRDYAKLTAALLFNLYPSAKIYFFTIPYHVATAIKIDDKYYILDQNLPVLTKDRRLTRWNRKDADVYVSELVRNSEGKLVKVNFDYHEKVSLYSEISEKNVDTDKLTAEVAGMLKIKQASQKEKPDFETSLKNYATYYEEDDITKHSLMKAIKNKLERELCGNMNKISNIEINQNENDLIVKVYL